MNSKETTFFKTPHFPVYLLSILVAILNSCALSPMYVQIESDIAFEYTLLPLIMNYAVLLFDTLYMAFLIAALVFSIYGIHKGIVSKKETYSYVIAIVLVKHILNLVVSSIIDGYIDIAFDIPMALYTILIDLLILAVIALISNHMCKKHFTRARAMIKATKYLEALEYNESEDVFPFKGFFKIKNNPILMPLFAGALITSLLFIIQRLFADFVVLGAPSTIIELVDIILSYLGDVLFGLISYVASRYAVSYIFYKANDN